LQKYLISLLFLALIFTPVSALEVIQTGETTPPTTTQTDTTGTQLQIINQRLASLEAANQTKPDNAYIDKKINDLASYLTIYVRDRIDMLTVILVVVILLQLAMWFGLFFYMKSTGRM